MLLQPAAHGGSLPCVRATSDMTTTLDQRVFRFVGKRTRRADAPERLTGQTRFTNDLVLPGAVFCRFVRSPYAAARVVSVDATAARGMPGVVAVLTARELPVVDIGAAVEA